MRTKRNAFLILLLSASSFSAAQIPYPGKLPGPAKVTSSGNRVVLENNVLRMEFEYDGQRIRLREFADKQSGEGLEVSQSPLFEMTLRGNRDLASDDFTMPTPPRISDVRGNPDSPVLAAELSGMRVSADLENPEEGLSVHWEAELRDGSNYVRQIFRFRADDADRISAITPMLLPAGAGIRREGTVDGSPLVRHGMFFALEHPLAKIIDKGAIVASYIPGFLPVLSTVWGVTPEGQLRRGFLHYVERERAHPYRQMLHYNTWYDIAWSGRVFNEEACIDRITSFGDNLVKARKVKMDAFLFDDGWDDHATLWEFHPGFPEGFANLAKIARSYGSGIGVWISPFGGYGKARESRLEYGRKQNPPFETNGSGFSLAGPLYFKRFKEVTGNFLKTQGVFLFKFDGLGAGLGAGSGDDAAYLEDVKAFLRLLDELKAEKPDLYLSLTVGTWPSVYWLKWGDNIWRGGDDTNMTGEGSKRRQWITYRDAETYKNVVKRGPLYPLNSLMLCGICIADHGNPGKFEMNDQDISDEIWSFFATGCNLQELYVNPHKLSPSHWDVLAEAARWARDNERIMADVHWVGGDPAKGEVYGFAAWSPQKAVLSLRNPSGAPKTFVVDASEVFELHGLAGEGHRFIDARAAKPGGKPRVVAEGRSFRAELRPFEVIVLDALPLR